MGTTTKRPTISELLGHLPSCPHLRRVDGHEGFVQFTSTTSGRYIKVEVMRLGGMGWAARLAEQAGADGFYREATIRTYGSRKAAIAGAKRLWARRHLEICAARWSEAS